MSKTTKPDRTSKRGFASIDNATAEESRLKSIATRKVNAEKRNLRLDKAKIIRAEIAELKKQIEVLEQKADELDGEITATRNKRRYEAKVSSELEELLGGIVSPQYLKQAISHAIRSGLSADQVITPIQAAMDILHDPDANKTDKKDAIKLLSAFENSKPVAKDDPIGDSLGSVQDELNKLMDKHGDIAPKRKRSSV